MGIFKEIIRGIFKDDMTGWLSIVDKNGEYDLKAHSESIKLLIEVNNQELSVYTNYLIAIFSFFVPIYIALLKFNMPISLLILIYLVIGELNLIGIITLLRKIKFVQKGNDSLIEKYNAIQSKLGKSFLVRIDGEKEKVDETVKQISKKGNFESVFFKT